LSVCSALFHFATKLSEEGLHNVPEKARKSPLNVAKEGKGAVIE